MSLYSMARIWRVNISGLVHSECHARRDAPKAKARVVRDAPPITYVPEGATADPLAYADLYRSHVEGAFVPKARTKALHLLVKFPASVPVASEADARMALDLAVDFARSIFGDEAVFAARMDRDETSLTNADLFIAPCYMKKTKHTERKAVSMTKHLKELASSYARLPSHSNGLKEQGQALQDEFAKFLRGRGYQALRGQPKTTEGPDWTSPEAYGVRTDRAIADATLEVAKEYYHEGTVERDAAERDRETASRGLKVVEEEWKLVIDERFETGRAAEDARSLHNDMLGAADEQARKVEDDAKDAAKNRLDQAAEEARRITAEAAREAQARLSAIEEEEARIRQASQKADDDRKRAADLVREAQVVAEAAAAQKEEAQKQAQQIGHYVIETEQALAAARTREKQAAGTCEANDLTARQLDLVDRASRDDALALAIDDSPRGVSMNEAAMTQDERVVYRAPWSAIARSIARAIAEAVRSVRNILHAARQEADTMRGAANARIVVDRDKLTEAEASLDEQRVRLREDRADVDQQAGRARDFLEAWELVPPDRRSPKVATAILAARGLVAQVGDKPAAPIRPKGPGEPHSASGTSVGDRSPQER